MLRLRVLLRLLLLRMRLVVHIFLNWIGIIRILLVIVGLLLHRLSILLLLLLLLLQVLLLQMVLLGHLVQRGNRLFGFQLEMWVRIV